MALGTFLGFIYELGGLEGVFFLWCLVCLLTNGKERDRERDRDSERQRERLRLSIEACIAELYESPRAMWLL